MGQRWDPAQRCAVENGVTELVLRCFPSRCSWKDGGVSGRMGGVRLGPCTLTLPNGRIEKQLKVMGTCGIKGMLLSLPVLTLFSIFCHPGPGWSAGLGLPPWLWGSVAQELRHFVWHSDPSPVLLYQLLKGRDEPCHAPYFPGWQLSRVAMCFCPKQAALLLPFLQSFLGPSQAAVPSCPGSSGCAFVSGLALGLGPELSVRSKVPAKV